MAHPSTQLIFSTSAVWRLCHFFHSAARRGGSHTCITIWYDKTINSHERLHLQLFFRDACDRPPRPLSVEKGEKVRRATKEVTSKLGSRCCGRSSQPASQATKLS